MKKLLFISLLLGNLSLIASDKLTYSDSLSRAFDNCVFLHDSLELELKQCQLIAIDNYFIIEAIKEQLQQVNEIKSQLQLQIDNYKAIQTIQTADINNCIKEGAKNQRKSQLKCIGWGIGGGAIGAVFGILAGFFLVK
jgi:hypothetical protein